MIHAIINGLLTPAAGAAHVGHIKQHLLGPDGARLFDRPSPYHGGPQRYFQRAESSTFFGREIGIMYTHAHLRYAEAMARYGDADAFFLALRQANPDRVRAVVPSARPAAGELLLLELGRAVRRPLRGAGGVREGQDRQGRPRGRLARVFERRRHRAPPDPRMFPRHPPAEVGTGARSGDPQAARWAASGRRAGREARSASCTAHRGSDTDRLP